MGFRLPEILGTNKGDNFAGAANRIYFGLSGDDIFTGKTGNDFTIFVGGTGNDTYQVKEGNSYITIIDMTIFYTIL